MKRLFAVFLLMTAACAPAGSPSSELTPISLQLGAAHQALYAGLYAADQNGDYAREGLAVSFIEGSINADLVTPLVDGTAQFGVTGAINLISERANNQPVRALATILRRDPIVFFSLADSGIVRLENFVGKKVQVSVRTLPRLHAMLAYASIDANSMEVLTTASVTDLYSGEVDVASGLLTGVVLQAQRDGYEVNVIYPDDYGVHFYATTIFTTDDFIDQNPELVTRFLRASLQGWAYAVESPEAAGALVTKYNPDANADFESASMIASVPYINTGEDYIGWMEPEVWEAMAETMRAQNELTGTLDINDVYTLDFIEQIYGEANS